ncbi:hypothetical protein [Rossellomorea sp. DA94]|uniref:hypothetical protein n=1 Tax=Rossellomorea sp. DA94 TaxID=3038653 RepID=UPI002448CD17|nr:hypothetical protein [Rossellomorea sp. DA94]WGG44697.1 hypothetical protein P8596_18275 [Rossellomorea sp. DA94]
MSKIDIAMTLYMIVLISAAFLSYMYGSKMIRKTGLFLSQTVISGFIYASLGLLAILGWSSFTFKINEFLFFGGLVLGIASLAVGEIILLVIFLLKRNKWIAGQ